MPTRVPALLWERVQCDRRAGVLGTTEEGCREMTVFIVTGIRSGCKQPPGSDSCSFLSEGSEFCMHTLVKFPLVLITLSVISWESETKLLLTFPSPSDSWTVKPGSLDFSPSQLIASRTQICLGLEESIRFLV